MDGLCRGRIGRTTVDDDIQLVSFSLADSLAGAVGFTEALDLWKVFGPQAVECVEQHELQVHVDVVL